MMADHNNYRRRKQSLTEKISLQSLFQNSFHNPLTDKHNSLTTIVRRQRLENNEFAIIVINYLVKKYRKH